MSLSVSFVFCHIKHIN